MAQRTTILDAAVAALNHRAGAASAREIYDEIVTQRLYEFQAVDPIGVLRGAIAKHLRVAKERPRLTRVGPDRYQRVG